MSRERDDKPQTRRKYLQKTRLIMDNYLKYKKNSWDFPGGTAVKNPPANAGDTGSIPSLGRSHMPQSN